MEEYIRTAMACLLLARNERQHLPTTLPLEQKFKIEYIVREFKAAKEEQRSVSAEVREMMREIETGTLSYASEPGDQIDASLLDAYRSLKRALSLLKA